jgi:hypothetical protein
MLTIFRERSTRFKFGSDLDSGVPRWARRCTQLKSSPTAGTREDKSAQEAPRQRTNLDMSYDIATVR